MKKVYCEHGAFDRRLEQLEDCGKIELYIFQYEQQIGKIRRIATPSDVTPKDINYTFGEYSPTFSEGTPSDKFKEIERIVGKSNRKDVLHLDSAYKTGCQYFLTPDKKDIVSKRRELEPLLGLKIFHSSEIELVLTELGDRISRHCCCR